MQWGDEGKGKITDFLAPQAEAVIRFAGGPNAGHRVVKNGVEYDFHLLPSGILNENTTVAIGNNVVVDIEQLLSELDMVKKSGVQIKDRLYLSERAHIIFPSYREEDKKTESERRKPIGTTGKGIGVAYSRKATRDGIRVVDMKDPEMQQKLSPEEFAYLQEQLKNMYSTLLVTDMNEYVDFHEGKNVLLEGAQGSLLDVDLGTYPYVTGTNTGIAAALVGMGRGMVPNLNTIGVLKMYSTRVGNGPFPTEFKESESELLAHVRETGHEYGITTGRPRRCGYLDLVALKYTCKINNVKSLALTHTDVYDAVDNIAFCTAYKSKDGKFTRFPASNELLRDVEIELEYFDGWMTDTTQMKTYADLPENLKSCINYIENYVGARVDIVSVGPADEQTIVRQSPWEILEVSDEFDIPHTYI